MEQTEQMEHIDNEQLITDKILLASQLKLHHHGLTNSFIVVYENPVLFHFSEKRNKTS